MSLTEKILRIAALQKEYEDSLVPEVPEKATCRFCGTVGRGGWHYVGGQGYVYECDDVGKCHKRQLAKYQAQERTADYQRGFEAGVAHAQETVGLWYVARPVSY